MQCSDEHSLDAALPGKDNKYVLCVVPVFTMHPVLAICGILGPYRVTVTESDCYSHSMQNRGKTPHFGGVVTPSYPPPQLPPGGYLG